MATYFAPRAEIQDSSGNPYSGALAYFYATGTSTPKAVYTNEALTIAHANPVVADSSGRWPAIYLATDAAYSIVIKTAAGVTIYSEDPHRPAVLHSTYNTLSTSFLRAASNPVHYGALGDGVADESTYVQSAITNATNVVDLLGLTYRCDSQLTVPSNRTIINGTLNFSSCTASDGFIKLTGSLGSLQAMSTVAAGATSLTSTLTPACVAGDLIRLQATSGFYSDDHAEFQRVKSVSGTTVNFDGKTHAYEYNSGASAQYAVVSPVSKVTFENVQITGALTGTRYGIYATYAEQLALRNVSLTNINTHAVYLANCFRVDVDGAHIQSSNGAIFIDGCERVTVRRLEDEGYTGTRIKIAKAIDTTGQGVDIVSRYIRITDSVIDGGTYSILVGMYSSDVTIDGCTFHNAGTAAIYCNSNNLRVSNCTIEDGTGIGISLLATQTGGVVGNVFTGNRISTVGDCFDLGDNTHSLYDLIISQNSLASSAGNAIDAYAYGSAYLNIGISNNTLFVASTNAGLKLSVRDGTVTGLSFCGNTFRGATNSSYGVYLTADPAYLGAASDIVVAGNAFSNYAYGIRYTDLLGPLVLANNVFKTANATASIFIERTDATPELEGLSISGNASLGGTKGCYISAAGGVYSGVAISGNSLMSAVAQAIHLLTSSSGVINYTAIAGNACGTDVTTVTDCIESVGGGANEINRIAVVGNATLGGRYAASFTNDANSTHSANVAAGTGTGTSNGATVVDGTNTP
jgi:hypothetical protein